MHIRHIYALRGPNIWSRSPVLEAWVDLEELKDSPSDSIPGFNERLMDWLPSMIEHRCSIGERGGFFERLRRGTYMAHILEHVSLELQTLAGSDMGFGRARETSEEGVYKVAIKFEEEQLARACIREAHELVLAAVYDRPYDISATVKRLREVANLVCFGPSTGSIVQAARERDIPVRRLDDGSLVQLGHGCKQHRIRMAETDQTSAIAQDIAQDKEVTKQLLASVGVPVPGGRAVESAADAWEAACEIGLPVVVKPRNANHGRGVAINLTDREQIMKAYDTALPEGDGVLVEQFVLGGEHRLLVIDGKFVAAARGEPEQVVGDGKQSVRELVDEINRDPRRGDDWASPLYKIEIDPVAIIMLAKQGYTPESIPPRRKTVTIHYNGELLTDVTDIVHPEIAQTAVLAARVVGLNIAGIDMIARDISQPMRAQGAKVIEVNAGPGLRMHLEPEYGTPRPVGKWIVATVFPNEETGRIPLISVTGTNGKTIVCRLLRHLLAQHWSHVGLTCSEGVFVDGYAMDQGECTGPSSARAVLLHPDVDAAVFETARGGILRSGLGFDQCSVAVVLNIGVPDRLGHHDIETPEKMALVKRSAVDVTLKGTGVAVLNAQDPLVAAMASYSRGTTTFFADRADDPIVAEHVQQGGRAVVASAGQIVLVEGSQQTPLMPLAEAPLTLGGRVPFQVQNVLAAVAAGWAVGLSLDQLRQGVKTFQADLATTIGRFNLIEHGSARVVLDHCHNEGALAALIEALEAIPHRRRTVVYSALGDRREADIVRQGEQLAAAFDRVVLYDHDNTHDRLPGEIPALLQQGTTHGGRVKELVVSDSPTAAVQQALANVQSEELIVIQTGVCHAALLEACRILGLEVPVELRGALHEAPAASLG